MTSRMYNILGYFYIFDVLKNVCKLYTAAANSCCNTGVAMLVIDYYFCLRYYTI